MNAVARQIERNLTDVRGRIAGACERSGRDPSDVVLVAVTKYARPEWVRELVGLGVRELGESRPQQLVERAEWFPTDGPDRVNWHLIGPLQRNKARRVVAANATIHSADSVRLLTTLDRLAGEAGVAPRILLEVNVAGEDQKHGFAPQQLEDDWSSVADCRRLQIAGLMTMAPYDENPENARPVFRRLRELRDRLASLPGGLAPPELSMGMSGDFEVGIEEGATFIRLGSGLFAGLE